MGTGTLPVADVSFSPRITSISPREEQYSRFLEVLRRILDHFLLYCWYGREVNWNEGVSVLFIVFEGDESME